MAPPFWATSEQRDFLFNNVEKYLEAQNSRSIHKFWPPLFEEWFEKFPERDVLPAPPEGAERTQEEEHVLLGEAIKARQNKLQQWFRNRTNNSRKGKNAKNATFEALKANVKKRALQPAEVYSQMFYKDRVQAAVAGELAELKLSRGEKIVYVKRRTKEFFNEETDEVKALVEAEMDSRRTNQEIAVSAEPTNGQREEMLSDLPAVINVFLESVQAQTGWAFTLIGGGPTPSAGGALQTIAFHRGKTTIGHDFAQISPEFNDLVIPLFGKFLKLVYPPEIRRSRALRPPVVSGSDPVMAEPQPVDLNSLQYKIDQDEANEDSDPITQSRSATPHSEAGVPPGLLPPSSPRMTSAAPLSGLTNDIEAQSSKDQDLPVASPALALPLLPSSSASDLNPSRSSPAVIADIPTFETPATRDTGDKTAHLSTSASGQGLLVELSIPAPGLPVGATQQSHNAADIVPPPPATMYGGQPHLLGGPATFPYAMDAAVDYGFSMGNTFGGDMMPMAAFGGNANTFFPQLVNRPTSYGLTGQFWNTGVQPGSFPLDFGLNPPTYNLNPASSGLQAPLSFNFDDSMMFPGPSPSLTGPLVNTTSTSLLASSSAVTDGTSDPATLTASLPGQLERSTPTLTPRDPAAVTLPSAVGSQPPDTVVPTPATFALGPPHAVDADASVPGDNAKDVAVNNDTASSISVPRADKISSMPSSASSSTPAPAPTNETSAEEPQQTRTGSGRPGRNRKVPTRDDELKLVSERARSTRKNEHAQEPARETPSKRARGVGGSRRGTAKKPKKSA